MAPSKLPGAPDSGTILERGSSRMSPDPATDACRVWCPPAVTSKAEVATVESLLVRITRSPRVAEFNSRLRASARETTRPVVSQPKFFHNWTKWQLFKTNHT